MTAKISAFFVGALFLVLASHPTRAADQAAVVQQVTALDDAASTAYTNGDFDKMKKQLLKALSLGKDALSTHPIMARVYLHFGVLYVDGLDNRAVGVKYFVKALKIRPDIEVRSNMATKTVMSAFGEAGKQQEAGAGGDEGAKEAVAPAKPAKREAVAEKEEVETREAEPERRPVRAAAAPEKIRGNDADLLTMKKEAREEFDRMEKALTVSKDALAKERAESEKLRKDKMDLERQLGEAKQRVTQLENDSAQKDQRSTASALREKKEHDSKEALEKEKSQKDSLLLDTTHKLQQLEKDTAAKDKELAATAAREKKEREAKEKLEREKPEREKAVADLKQRLQQVEKDSADKDKLLAATTEREKKEREAKEKLEHERQTADAHDRERKSWEDRARAERDKVEAVPPLPSRIPEPLHCALPEEIQGGADLFVRCVAQPTVRAKTIIFYYRPPSSTVYNALVLDPTSRGWSRAVITANKLNGKLLQYYAEARDSKDSIAATNGKASSPNIVTISSPGKH